MNHLTAIESMTPAAERPDVLRCPKCDRLTVGYCYGCRSDEMHRLLQEERRKVGELEKRLGMVSVDGEAIIPIPELEANAIRAAVRTAAASGISLPKLSRMLGIGNTTMYRKMKELGIPLPTSEKIPKPPSVRKATERVVEIARAAGVPELRQAIEVLDHAKSARITKEAKR